MKDYYLAFSELTKRVYLTNGKSKKDITDNFNNISVIKYRIDNDCKLSDKQHNESIFNLGQCQSCFTNKII